MTADATDGVANLYESVGSTVRLVGILPDGTVLRGAVTGLDVARGSYTPRVISSDGSRIFFTDPATGNLYVRIDGTSSEQLNVSEKSARETAAPATFWTASSDGRRAFFITAEGLVDGDDDGVRDLYMSDASAPAGSRLTRISLDGSGGGHFTELVIGASEDGRYVYFVDDGQLLAGQPPLVGGRAVYVWHDGALTLIGQFDSLTAATFNSPDTSWGLWPTTTTGRLSPDGRHLLFMTQSDRGFRGHGGFAGYDHGSTCTFDTSLGGPCRELYVYSADTDTLVCASCGPTGSTATGDALVQEHVGTGTTVTTRHVSHALSDDGRRVFFNTGQALVSADANGKVDAYEYDVSSGQVHLISSGVSPSDSYFLDASANGDDVFFVTRERLVGWDVDDNYDVYDARVGGGLPEPALAPVGCAGEACQGGLAGSPAVGMLASSVLHGAGDLPGRLKSRSTGSRARRRARRRCKRASRAAHAKAHAKRRCVKRKAVGRSVRRSK